MSEAREIPIKEIAQRLGLGDPIRTGKEIATLCPLHDDNHPSLRLNRENNLWYCHVCAEGGDGIKLVERVLRVPFRDAVNWLASQLEPVAR